MVGKPDREDAKTGKPTIKAATAGPGEAVTVEKPVAEAAEGEKLV